MCKQRILFTVLRIKRFFQRFLSEKDNGVHRSSHKMEPFDCTESDFVDGDYVKLGETSKGYNYLDPNFLPAAT